jgi:hypothetical protein
MIIPIIEVLDRETQYVVALASDDTKAEKMIAALTARAKGEPQSYYAEPALPVDTIAF